ncbi:nitroreductase/quinone reductase family protein [Gandjariella thermophila]|uniref:Nitroreductase n=1 Tax=Gandjariella thermophila TaxID=1931992 RepID=A0A4D4J5C4_9PSEU|nr:nitroreductase/quinone reductase family protein [Gandjariella thermophila]GDY31731.1 hypothetical protein GTS_33640 [Gandjariella thermophila]
MTSFEQMTPRERNAHMIERIRGGEHAPYQEGRHVLRVLSAPGRVTGEPRPWPIAVTQVDGRHYVAAPNRRRDWVRNLLAAGRCSVERDEQPDRRATLVEGDEAAAAVATYLAALGRPSTLWPFPSDAPVERIRRHTAEIAVFRLEPIGGAACAN